MTADWFTHPLPHGLDETSREADFWPTPRHAIESLLDSDPPPTQHPVLEPCAGDGAIVKVLLERSYEVFALEIREEEIAGLNKLCTAINSDFLTWEPGSADGLHSVITNPPFSLARQFARQALEITIPGDRYVALLLRCNVLGSGPWAHFWNEHPPSKLRPLKRRPSFSGDGKTDGAEYLWVIWDQGPPIDLRVI